MNKKSAKKNKESVLTEINELVASERKKKGLKTKSAKQITADLLKRDAL